MSISIYLCHVGRNLNRAYRLLSFFNIPVMYSYNCNLNLKGNLFKASGTVEIKSVASVPDNENTIYFETNGKESIYDVDLSKFSNFVFGGESKDLPKNREGKRVIIPNKGAIDGLTVESAIAIALFKREIDISNQSG